MNQPTPDQQDRAAHLVATATNHAELRRHLATLFYWADAGARHVCREEHRDETTLAVIDAFTAVYNHHSLILEEAILELDQIYGLDSDELALMERAVNPNDDDDHRVEVPAFVRAAWQQLAREEQLVDGYSRAMREAGDRRATNDYN